jgi:hypothetical protein
MIHARDILSLTEESNQIRLPGTLYGVSERVITISENPSSISAALTDLKRDIRNLPEWYNNKILRFFADFDSMKTYVWVSYLAVHNEVLPELFSSPQAESLLYGFWSIPDKQTEITWADESIVDHKNFPKYMKIFLSRYGNFKLDSIWMERGMKPGKEFRDWDSFLNYRSDEA